MYTTAIIIMISITTVIQYIRKYKHRRTLLFQIRTGLLTSCLSSTRGRRHNFYSANPTRSASRFISAGRDLKNITAAASTENSTLWLHGPTSTSQLTLFQNFQILRTISSGQDIIHTPASFSVWCFIMTMVIIISFAHERKLHQLTIHLGS